MPERTTIAETLTHIFAALEKSTSSSPNHSITLLQAWTGVFGGAGRTTLDVVQSIGQVCSVLLKLEAQLNASRKLKPVLKASGLAIVANFEVLFEVQRFHENSWNFRGNCSELHRGNLGLLGYSLESEFSEPKLEKNDAGEITEALQEIKAMLSDSGLPLDLRLSMSKHVDAMIWWLAHPEFASLQDLFETAGAVMVVAKQIKDRENGSASADAAPGQGIFEKAIAVGQRLGRLVGLAERGMEVADRLGADVQHLLSSINPPT